MAVRVNCLPIYTRPGTLPPPSGSASLAPVDRLRLDIGVLAAGETTRPAADQRVNAKVNIERHLNK